MTDEQGSNSRQFDWRHVVSIVAVTMSLFHLYFGIPFIGPPKAEIFYPLHVTFILLVLFGDSAASAVRGRAWGKLAYDLILIAMAVAATGYLMLNADYIANRFTYAEPLLPVEKVLGGGFLFVLLEAARRTVGWVLVVIAGVFLVYALIGDMLPGIFYHQGFSVGRVIELSYMTTDGVWNAPIAVAAAYIFLFVLFGSLLLSSGAGSFFTDLARALTGRTIGGPAKTAVVASALMGMLSGSAAANVVTTGSFTIPAMKQAGYRPEFAAGVEAVASTGGQITPPILGAAAFLMIEFVGVSYAEIITFSIIPAILYFFAVFAMVDLEARRLGLNPAVDEKLPKVAAVLRQRGYLLVPVVVLIWFLFQGYTASAAGFWSIVSLAAMVVALDGENRRRIHHVVWEALAAAPRLMVAVSIACAVGGMLAGLIILTGLGAKISTLILTASGGVIIVALLLTLLAAIVLGMGMPTSGAYIILAALLAPGLAQMGIPEIPAHMFIIYCAAMSGITPPVAISSFAAAAIAGTDPWKTSWAAIKLGLSVYIVPFMFVYGPALLGFGTALEVISTAITAAIGILALSVACVGWLKVPLRWYERVVAFAAALPMINAGFVTDLVGLALVGILLSLIWLRTQGGAERHRPRAHPIEPEVTRDRT